MADFNENMPLTIALSGRIDSLNAEKTETEIRQILNGSAPETLIIDAKDLVYLSSAGLRIILRLKKSCSGLKIIHVNPEVYDILEMTGFTEMLQVEKAYRVISVENCEVIGEGFNGIVYKIDRETIVKVYKNDDPLSAIQHEREVARLALILGVPTAISYDVVQVGSSYGSVFELLNARSFSRILAEEPEKMDWCVREYTELLRTIHGIQVPEGKLPSMKEENRKNILRVKSYLPAELGEKLVRMASCNSCTEAKRSAGDVAMALRAICNMAGSLSPSPRNGGTMRLAAALSKHSRTEPPLCGCSKVMISYSTAPSR